MNNDYEIVYLLQHKSIPEYTKIGYTTRKDLKKRMNELNTASPTGIIKIAEFHLPKGRAHTVEQALHARYSSYQSNLEWYKLSESQIAEITTWVNGLIKKTSI